MPDVSISEIMYTMFSLLFLLLGVVLIVSILASTFSPYDQVAFANVEKLRASMDQACATGSEVNIRFDLPQNTPKSFLLFTVMPIWIIRTSGDPNYVLYYESFPPGDAVGWEVYHGMPTRLVGPFPDGEGKNSEDVANYVQGIVDEWHNTRRTTQYEFLDGSVVNNIILGGNRSDFYLFQQAPGARVNIGPSLDISKYGEWKFKNTDGSVASGDNQFVFKNYVGLNPFEKTAIKYIPCGENALCLKTRKAVYRFPLRQCNDIKSVQLIYDARNRKAIYGTALGAAAVVAGGAVILGAGGVAVGTAATGTGLVEASVLENAVAVAPGVYAATIGGQTVPIFATATASGTAVYTTAAATTTATGSFLSILSSLVRSPWSIVKGFARGLLWIATRIPIVGPPIAATLGAGALGGTGVATWKFGEFLAGSFLSYKVEDFNIASSCSISQMTIKRTKCDTFQAKWSSDYKPCTRVINYPLYEYGSDGKLHQNGTHYACVEKIGTDMSPLPDEQFGSDDYCLQVRVDEKAEGFCWTPDPYKDAWLSDTQYVAEKLEFFPVRQNTAFMTAPQSSYVVVLKNYPLGDLERWKDWFERKISWGWPG